MKAKQNRPGTVLGLARTFTLIAAFFVPFAAHAESREAKRPMNFGTVIEGKIYRGGQPTTSDIARLGDMGVKTILKLNTRRASQEKEAARRAGMRFIHIPFQPDEIGKPATCRDVARALEVMMDESNWPIYVHCARGQDRAGYMVGLYRQIAHKWSWSRVNAELTKFGHEEGERRSYPQIVRELRAGAPSCGPVVEQAIRSSSATEGGRDLD